MSDWSSDVCSSDLDQLSSDLRDQILAAAQELGYVGPDPAARALARGTAGAVGVLLTDSLRYAFTDEVATGFLGAIVDELAPSGVALTLLTSDERGEAVPARDVAVDGAVVYSCLPQSNRSEERRVGKEGVSTVRSRWSPDQ